jgi:hypothetical protein
MASKYYVYSFVLSELDIENNKTDVVFEMSYSASKLHKTKDSAFLELRDILNTRCDKDAITDTL